MAIFIEERRDEFGSDLIDVLGKMNEAKRAGAISEAEWRSIMSALNRFWRDAAEALGEPSFSEMRRRHTKRVIEKIDLVSAEARNRA